MLYILLGYLSSCVSCLNILGYLSPDLTLSILSQDYQVDLYLRQAWVDERLNHPDIIEPLDLNDPNLVKAIWKPEVYFPNSKHAEFQFVTVPNVLVRINPLGEILYMLRCGTFGFLLCLDVSTVIITIQHLNSAHRLATGHIVTLTFWI